MSYGADKSELLEKVREYHKQFKEKEEEERKQKDVDDEKDKIVKEVDH